MLRVLQIVFAPATGWLRIAEANRGFFFVFGLSFIPMLAVALGLEAWGLTRWGDRRGAFATLAPVPAELVLRFALAHAALFTVATLLTAFSLFSVGRSFHLAAGFTQAFTTSAYGLGPIILMHIFDGFPAVPTWVCWSIGAVLSAASLYHGIALVMKPEQTKGFGLYLVAVLVAWTSTAVAHLLGLAVLQGRLWPG